MSKNKEKPWSPTVPPEAGKHRAHEDVEKSRTASAGQASASGARMADDRPPPKDNGPKPPRDDGSQKPPDVAADQAGKLAQLQDRLLRLQADFDNFRKRTLREKNDLFDSANQALMLEILPVLDHLHLGIQASAAHQENVAFREGLTLICDQLMGVLSKFGLHPIETENKVFDPNQFEAVSTLPSAKEPEGKILAMVRRGYMVRNKMLRPAQVIVSSGPPPAEQADGAGQTPRDAGQAQTKDGCQQANGPKE